LARGDSPFTLLTFWWVSSKHSSVTAASVHELAFAVSGLLIRTRLAMRVSVYLKARMANGDMRAVLIARRLETLAGVLV
jgi:hypothetical protein